MILCLSCKRTSDAGAQFCENCGKSFGARLCPHHHMTSFYATHCGTCGSVELTQPTWFVRFSLGLRLIYICGILLLYKAGVQAWHYDVDILAIAWRLVNAVVLYVSGKSLTALWGLLLTVLILWGFGWVLIRTLTRPDSKLPDGYVALSKGAVCQLLRGLVAAVRYIGRFTFVQGKKDESRKS